MTPDPRIDLNAFGNDGTPERDLPGYGGVFNQANLNLYGYATQNPVKFVDPDGNIVFVPVIIGAAKVTGWAVTAYSAYQTAHAIASGEKTVGEAVKEEAVGFGIGLATLGTGKILHKAYKAHQTAKFAEQTTDLGTKIEEKVDAAIEAASKLRVKKLGPHPEASGPHTTFKRDPKTGRVSGYTEFDEAGRPVKRFRGEGRTHGGVDPPLILEPKPGKGPGAPLKEPRQPKSDELPKGYE